MNLLQCGEHIAAREYEVVDACLAPGCLAIAGMAREKHGLGAGFFQGGGRGFGFPRIDFVR